mmetsp:Transcript_163920/g.298969  ORF Transcript_163920/g.298969 Transcript_163920/m.298969 type:complete len:241 (+) Transcript_163920:2194-2916(+)
MLLADCRRTLVQMPCREASALMGLKTRALQHPLPGEAERIGAALRSPPAFGPGGDSSLAARPDDRTHLRRTSPWRQLDPGLEGHSPRSLPRDTPRAASWDRFGCSHRWGRPRRDTAEPRLFSPQPLEIPAYPLPTWCPLLHDSGRYQIQAPHPAPTIACMTGSGNQAQLPLACTRLSKGTSSCLEAPRPQKRRSRPRHRRLSPAREMHCWEQHLVSECPASPAPLKDDLSSREYILPQPF